jgi:hypothetical protein
LKMASFIIYSNFIIFWGEGGGEQSGREWYNKRVGERYSLDILKNSSAARCQQKGTGVETLLIASVEFKRLERNKKKRKKSRKVGFRLYPSFQPWHSYTELLCVYVV